MTEETHDRESFLAALKDQPVEVQPLATNQTGRLAHVAGTLDGWDSGAVFVRQKGFGIIMVPNHAIAVIRGQGPPRKATLD